MSIILEKVTKKYKNDEIILSEADYVFEDKKAYSIIGKSGSGKSTLLNLISGIDSPDGGKIIVNGFDITNRKETEKATFRFKNLGFVFQFFYLQPYLNVLENVKLPTYISKENDAEVERRAIQLLSNVGLEKKIKSFPKELSGGEMQRAAIARALINNPSIILADEPTGNLDETNSTIVIDLLKRVCAENGCMLLLATHDKGIMNRMDVNVSIKDGKITNENI